MTLPFSVREGINIFLAGFVPTENLRFRDEALTFKARLASARFCPGCRWHCSWGAASRAAAPPPQQPSAAAAAIAATVRATRRLPGLQLVHRTVQRNHAAGLLAARFPVTLQPQPVHAWCHVPTQPITTHPASLLSPLRQVSDQGTEGDEEQKKFLNYKYPAMSKTQGSFTLHVSHPASRGPALPAGCRRRPRMLLNACSCGACNAAPCLGLGLAGRQPTLHARGMRALMAERGLRTVAAARRPHGSLESWLHPAVRGRRNARGSGRDWHLCRAAFMPTLCASWRVLSWCVLSGTGRPSGHAGGGWRVHRLGDYRHAWGERHRQDHLHPHAGWHAQAGWVGRVTPSGTCPLPRRISAVALLALLLSCPGACAVAAACAVAPPSTGQEAELYCTSAASTRRNMDRRALLLGVPGPPPSAQRQRRRPAREGFVDVQLSGGVHPPGRCRHATHAELAVHALHALQTTSWRWSWTSLLSLTSPRRSPPSSPAPCATCCTSASVTRTCTPASRRVPAPHAPYRPTLTCCSRCRWARRACCRDCCRAAQATCGPRAGPGAGHAQATRRADGTAGSPIPAPPAARHEAPASAPPACQPRCCTAGSEQLPPEPPPTLHPRINKSRPTHVSINPPTPPSPTLPTTHTATPHPTPTRPPPACRPT